MQIQTMKNKIIDWFFKPPTTKSDVVSWIVVAIIYIFLFILLLNIEGCASFEKTTGYEQNKVWRTK